MVYNPPIERANGGDPTKPAAPVATVPVNPMRRGAYIEQAARASAWALLYLLGWILMRLLCHLGLPNDCILAKEPLEVLTDILTLLVFSLGQVRGRHIGSGFYIFPRALKMALYCGSGSSWYSLWGAIDL